MPNPVHPYFDLIDICNKYGATLLAVSKTRKEKEVQALYDMGQRIFGENRAHELIIKASLLPSDIQWHMIGHLQTNKVQPVLSYVSCIQSLDSLKLWKTIQAEAVEANLHIECLLQIKIATEETKYGWAFEELEELLEHKDHLNFPNVHITGVMGMASLTRDTGQVRAELKQLKRYFDLLKEQYFSDDEKFKILSMGMSGDYNISLEEGSTMIRIGSLLFM